MSPAFEAASAALKNAQGSKRRRGAGGGGGEWQYSGGGDARGLLLTLEDVRGCRGEGWSRSSSVLRGGAKVVRWGGGAAGGAAEGLILQPVGRMGPVPRTSMETQMMITTAGMTCRPACIRRACW